MASKIMTFITCAQYQSMRIFSNFGVLRLLD